MIEEVEVVEVGESDDSGEGKDGQDKEAQRTCIESAKADTPLSNLARFVPLFCVEVGVAARDLVDLPVNLRVL